MSKIRINELARELEVKPQRILELLPEVGVAEKKTHSSSLDEDAADLVRKHFGVVGARPDTFDHERDHEPAGAAADRGARSGGLQRRPRPQRRRSTSIAHPSRRSQKRRRWPVRLRRPRRKAKRPARVHCLCVHRWAARVRFSRPWEQCRLRRCQWRPRRAQLMWRRLRQQRLP
jgi:hypothetical protein